MKYSAVLIAAVLAASPMSVLAACPHGYSEHEMYRGAAGTLEFNDPSDDTGPTIDLHLKTGHFLCPATWVDDSPQAAVVAITCGPYSEAGVVFHTTDGDATLTVDFDGHTYKRDCSLDLGL